MENYISAMQVVLMRGIRPETHFLCARIVTAAHISHSITPNI